MKISSLLSRRSARRRGLTLIEILVVSAIFAIIVTSLSVVFKAGLDSWSRTQAHLEVFQTARAALDMMTRDLSAAYLNANDANITFQGYAAGATGWVAPTSGTDSEVFFIAALNPTLNDPNVRFELCQVGYWRNSATNELRRYYFTQTGAAPDYDFSAHTGTPGNHGDIANNVTAFTLQYFGVDATTGAPIGPLATWNSTAAGNPNQFRKKPLKVAISITVQEPNSARTQTFTTGVYIPQ